jgi:hypothetical protein
MQTRTILLLIGLVLVSVGVYKCKQADPYYEEKTRECILLAKMEQDGGKYSDDYIFVLQEKSTNIRFDLTVSPTTYALTQEGQTVFFTLSDQEVNFIPQPQWWEIIGFMGILIGGILLVVGAFWDKVPKE